MRSLFVYYKPPAAERTQWLPRVRAFCEAARARWPGLEVDLLQRPEPAADGRETWMEVYRHPDGVSDEMAAALDALAADHGLPFKRASEVFIPLRP